MKSKNEEETEGYKEYKAARDALSKVMDEHGQDVTLQAMIDRLADVAGLDAISILVEIIKEIEKKRYAEMRSKIAREIQHRKDVKDGKYIKQLRDRGKDRNFRKQFIERGVNVRKRLMMDGRYSDMILRGHSRCRAVV